MWEPAVWTQNEQGPFQNTYTQRWGRGASCRPWEQTSFLQNWASWNGKWYFVAERADTCKLRQATGERGQMSRRLQEGERDEDRRAKKAKEWRRRVGRDDARKEDKEGTWGLICQGRQKERESYSRFEIENKLRKMDEQGRQMGLEDEEEQRRKVRTGAEGYILG